MLAKIATAGQNGQFRTPRHIIALMVEMTAPGPKDVICDPACGTCGFLVAAGEYLRDNHPKLFHDEETRHHFHEEMFHGFDFDQTMLRIGSMNMTLHGVDDPDIRYKDSLSQEHAGDEDRYSLVLANPPFAGSLDYEPVGRYGPPLFQILKGLEGSHNVALMKADPKRGTYRSFLFYLLRAPRLQADVISQSERSAGQTGVNLKFLNDYPAYFPPESLQRTFDKVVEMYDAIVSRGGASMSSIDDLFFSLQHRAFSGQL
jgi:hypothetical protein